MRIGKKLVIVFAVALINLSWASADEVHIYLLGGQSNGTGRGNAAAVPIGSPLASAQADVRFWYRKTLNGSNNNTLPESQIIELAPGSGHGQVGKVFPVEFGPELGIGRTLSDAFPNQNVMIIKGTHGGSNLHTGWAANGTNYSNFVQTISEAVEQVELNGDTPVMMGMFWVQGESDAGNFGNAKNYGNNLADLVARVRNDFFEGSLAPFVLSQLSDNQYGSLGAGQLAVRAGQQQVADSDTEVGLVLTDDDKLYTTRDDIIHFDANGLINLGNSLGQQMAIHIGILGDLDCNGIVDQHDVELFVNLLTSSSFNAKADMDGNGDLNLLDVLPFVSLLSEN